MSPIAIELGTAYVSILPDTSKIAPDMKKAFGGAEKEAAKAGDKAGTGFGSGFTKAMKGAGLAAGAALVAGVAVAAKGGIESALNIDSATRSLTGLHGSAGQAADTIERVGRVSRDSSIDHASYTEAAKNLAYIGVEGEQLENILGNAGKAIVGFGGDGSNLDRVNDSLAKMVNNGKVNREELLQLSDAGIPIFEGLATHLGVTVEEMNKMVSDGTVGIEDVLSVMENGTGAYFGQLLDAGDEMEQGLGATWSRLKDNLKLDIGEAITNSGILDKMVPVVENLAGALENVVTFIVEDFVPALEGAVGWVSDNRDWLEPIAAGIIGIATAIGIWTVATGIATGVQAAFAAVMAITPLGWLIIGIGALVGVLIWFFTKTETGKKVWDWLVEAFKTGWEWIKDAFDKAWEFISGIWDSLVEAFETVKTKAGEFWDKVIEVWDGIKNAFQTAWDFIQPILQGIWDFLVLLGQIIFAVLLMPFVLAWQGLVAIVTWAWEFFLRPTWELIKLGLQALGDFFKWVWEALIKPAWDALGAGIRWVWDTIIRPAWDALKLALQAVGDFFVWIWNTIIKPAWDALGNGIKWVWETLIRPAWDALKAALGAVGDFFSWVWNSIIKPAWDALGNGIRWVIDTIIKPAFDVLKGALDSVGNFFRTIVDGIRRAWDEMKGHVARPINFVIEAVWNNGLVRAWNTIADFLPGLPRASTLSPVAFASGGEVPWMPGARRGKDSVHGLLMPGEHVLTAAEVKALGGQENVYAMREMIRKGVWPMGHGPDAMPKFAEGGAVPGARLSPSPGEAGMQDIAKLAKRLIHLIWPSIKEIGGVRPPDGYNEHSSGRALDVMVGVGNPIGDEVTGWALANDPVLPLQHAIWKQQMWYPGTEGGSLMPDRGDPTQNHMDHPHLWYKPKAIDPNVVPEGLVGPDGLSREDRLGIIKDKITEIIDKMMDPLIEAITGVVGTPPPEWLGIMPKVADKSKEGAIDAAFDFVENIGDTLKDVYNAAREVKDIVVSKVTGIFTRDTGGFIPNGQSVVNNETGKPEAVLNWEQLQSIIRLMESSAGMAALHRWAMGDIEAAMRHGVDRETIDSIGAMNLQLAEHMAETMRKAQESFFSSTKSGVLDFFGLSGLVGGIEEVWNAFHPTKDATEAVSKTAEPASGEVSGSKVAPSGGYQLDSSTVPLKDMPNLDDNRSPGSGPVVDQVKEAMAPFGWDKGAQWNAVDFIVSHESSWNPNAQNPTSTAYGLFQFLDSTWATVGAVKTSNPKLQGIAGRDYMKQRYQDPVGAERFWRANRWYDQGGWMNTGLSLVRNSTGKPEPVLNPSQWADISRQSHAVADLVEGNNRRGGAPLVVIENLQARDEDEAMRSAMREARRASRSNSLIGGW